MKSPLADLQTLIDHGAALDRLRQCKLKAEARPDLPDAAAQLDAATAQERKALARWRRLSPDRKAAAERYHDAGTTAAAYAHTHRALYSGETRSVTQWGDRPDAETTTSRGAQYSRACIYSRTDATHTVTLDPAGVIQLHDDKATAERSRAEGLPLIALYPDLRAVWVMSKGKRLIAESGWIVREGDICFHSEKSLDHARKGLARKVAALAKEAAERHALRKQERRVRLVARLCSGLSATIEDARALGYCAPGIAAFQARYGIQDAAALPELVRTGDPSAVRLALSVARRTVALSA